MVWSADEDGRVTLMSRNKIEPGQQVEFLLPGERPLVFTVPETGLRVGAGGVHDFHDHPQSAGAEW